MLHEEIRQIDFLRQEQFAEFSGDYNPLHVDTIRARRSQFGACVVHGIHLLLDALELLRREKSWRITALDAQFRGAVLVGERVSYTTQLLGEEEARFEVRVGSIIKATIKVEMSPSTEIGRVPEPTSWSRVVATSPRVADLAKVEGEDRLVVNEQLLLELFPGLSFLSRNDVAMLLATTRVIGMRCPGDYALFRRLVWRCDQPEDATLANESDQVRFEVTAVDERFSMLTLGLASRSRTVHAEVLLRNPPPPQASLGDIRDHVRPGEFSSIRAFIVGGSRGLGELAAKILVSGGAQILVSYRNGAEDAQMLASEVGKNAQVVRFAVENPDSDSSSKIAAFRPTHLLYFATPTISKRPANTWDQGTFEKFEQIYVSGFARLLHEVDELGSLRGVFFPSSIFVEELPTGFAEYSAAKLAGEGLCQVWRWMRPQQRVVVERLPPLVTDQTAAKLGTDAFGNLAVLLPTIRQLCESAP